MLARLSVQSMVRHINCFKEKKGIYNKDKDAIKIIKKSKTNNKSYIISKDKNDKEKNDSNVKLDGQKPLNKLLKKNILFSFSHTCIVSLLTRQQLPEGG